MTRPEGQANGLLEGIRALGGEATHCPFLAIEALAESAELRRIATHLNQYRACIFISANAVQLAWPVLVRAGWPASIAAAAIGPGTARVLHSYSASPVIVPASRFDSEGLLAESLFSEAQCRGQSFALIRGEGGRDYLAQTLRSRGAQVDEAAVYRRALHPEALPRLNDWLTAEPSPVTSATIVISSSESLERLVASASPQVAADLSRIPLLVPHPKIAEAAYRLGFSNVLLSDGGDAGLLRFLRSYNETNRKYHP